MLEVTIFPGLEGVELQRPEVVETNVLVAAFGALGRAIRQVCQAQ